MRRGRQDVAIVGPDLVETAFAGRLQVHSIARPEIGLRGQRGDSAPRARDKFVRQGNQNPQAASDVGLEIFTQLDDVLTIEGSFSCVAKEKCRHLREAQT